MGKAFQRLPAEDRKSVENPGGVEAAPGEDQSAGHSLGWGEKPTGRHGLPSFPHTASATALKGVPAHTTLPPKLQNPGEEGEEGLTCVASEGPEVKAPGQEVCAPSSA